ncbi:hypothetical protein RHMOL_Rhmol05G0124900 [Rhododendron molle]|uniref:Uncharacterized protein n=1 Tax=Rhododendron molle TaxID=49168 RepID=A0ACC0NPI0_RHOML|nr:hypothetical protein RHMOL_Rhmol05G0124900 [Rhododendron molle]
MAEIEVDLHRSKGQKQSKMSSRFLKAAKQKLGRAVSQFVLHARLPSSTINSPWLEPMLDVAREVGKGTKLPSSYEVAEVYLPKEYEAIQKWIGSLKTTWEERGVSIMCDGWSGPRRRHLVNFLVYSNCGTVFHKSIDATDVLSRTTDYYFGFMDKALSGKQRKKKGKSVPPNQNEIVPASQAREKLPCIGGKGRGSGNVIRGRGRGSTNVVRGRGRATARGWIAPRPN